MNSPRKIAIDLSACDLPQFEGLFRGHYKGLCYVAFQVLRDWPAAEDVVQEFFIKCWQNRLSIHIEDSFAAYAARGVRNMSLNVLEKEAVRQKHEQNTAVLEHEDPQSAAALQQQKDERYVRLARAIEELPEQRRKIFMLVHFHQLKYAQAADQLGVSVNTVKTHMKLAYSSLRECLLLLLMVFPYFV